jgi:hypothetical protein
MEAKELRIGNYINPLLDENEVAEICYISENDFGYERISDKEYFQGNSIKLIPLIEEWLLKFGFTDLGYGEWEKGDIILDNEYTDKGIWNISETVSHLSIDIKYVHQLQNIFFALTNEELKLI